MKINLNPRAINGGVIDLTPANVSKSGDKLTINGQIYDLSVIPDGATLPNAAEATDCPYFSGDISRLNSELDLTLVLMYEADVATEAARFPQPIINPPDGPLELPK